MLKLVYPERGPGVQVQTCCSPRIPGEANPSVVSLVWDNSRYQLSGRPRVDCPQAFLVFWGLENLWIWEFWIEESKIRFSPSNLELCIRNERYYTFKSPLLLGDGRGPKLIFGQMLACAWKSLPFFLRSIRHRTSFIGRATCAVTQGLVLRRSSHLV